MSTMTEEQPAVISTESGEPRREGHYRLVITVKRGSASTFPAAWARYSTIEDARVAAAATMREERVQRVMIVGDGAPGTFVEWVQP